MECFFYSVQTRIFFVYYYCLQGSIRQNFFGICTRVQEHKSTKVQEYNCTKVQEYNSTIVQEYNSTPAQQTNSITVQQYNSTRLH